MFFGMSIVQLLISVVVVIGCCLVVGIFCRRFGVTIPPWLLELFWVVVAVVLVIMAIKLIASVW